MKNLFLGPGPGFEPGPGDPQSPVLTRLHHPGHSHRKFWNRFIKFSSDSGKEGWKTHESKKRGITEFISSNKRK